MLPQARFHLSSVVGLKEVGTKNQAPLLENEKRGLSFAAIVGRLLYRAADLREDVAGVGADEPDRAHDDYENHRQHHRVFGDILSGFVGPELVQELAEAAIVS